MGLKCRQFALDVVINPKANRADNFTSPAPPPGIYHLAANFTLARVKIPVTPQNVVTIVANCSKIDAKCNNFSTQNVIDLE